MGRRALLAEFLGAFAYCFIGAGTAAMGLGGLLGAAVAHGLVFAAWSHAYGTLSGGHLNPAITLAGWATRQIDGVRALSYVAVQLLGGIAGAFALAWVLGGPETGLGAPTLSEGVSPVQGLILEALLTFFVVGVFLHTTSGRGAVGLVVGATLAAGLLMAGPINGACLNPARALGTAIASARLADLWIYLVGPVLGGLCAAGLFVTWLRPTSSSR